MTRRRVVLAIGCVATLSAAVALRARTATASDPRDTIAHSIAFFEARLERDPINGLVAGALADRYVTRFGTDAHLEDLGRAEALARAVLPVTRDRASALTRLSGILLARHAFADAADAARRAVSLDSTNEGARAAWFDASLATGRYEDAGSALLRLEPGTTAYELRRAYLLAAHGESGVATNVLERVCTQLERRNGSVQAQAWCLTELGRMMLDARGIAAARGSYERALDLLPGYRGAEERLAELDAADGRWQAAIRRYRRIAVDAHPDLYLRLAEASRAIGATDEAREWEQRFARVALQPDAEALYAPELARWLAERPGALDSALAVAQRNVARRPTVEAYDVLSWVQLQRGDLDAALSASDSARRWGTPSPTMDAHRGLILQAKGWSAEAFQLLRSAGARPELLEPHLRGVATEWRGGDDRGS